MYLVDCAGRSRLILVLNRSAIILSDLHLGPTCPPDAAHAASCVIRRHPGHETILLGDTFDLSLDPATLDPAISVGNHLARYPDFSQALREQLRQGVPVTLLPGNHDAQLAQPQMRGKILEHLGLTDRAPLSCGLWCVQRGGLHLEHGHVHDPDNAQTHPLVAPSHDTEPLGIAMMRKVLAPSNALYFAHAHELTPLDGLAQAFVQLGKRAPRLITRYYTEALRIVAQAKPATFANETLLGQNRLLEFAAASGIAIVPLQRVLEMRVAPRHHDKKAVIRRLYLDRSLATALFWSTSMLGVTTFAPAFWAISGISVAFLAASLARGKNRYSGSLVSRLRIAALNVRELLDARAVVFGHTHVEEVCQGYVNNGSFGFGGTRGRSYLLLESPESLMRVSVNGSHEPERLDVFMPRKSECIPKPEEAA